MRRQRVDGAASLKRAEETETQLLMKEAQLSHLAAEVRRATRGSGSMRVFCLLI